MIRISAKIGSFPPRPRVTFPLNSVKIDRVILQTNKQTIDDENITSLAEVITESEQYIIRTKHRRRGTGLPLIASPRPSAYSSWFSRRCPRRQAGVRRPVRSVGRSDVAANLTDDHGDDESELIWTHHIRISVLDATVREHPRPRRTAVYMSSRRHAAVGVGQDKAGNVGGNPIAIHYRHRSNRLLNALTGMQCVYTNLL